MLSISSYLSLFKELDFLNDFSWQTLVRSLLSISYLDLNSKAEGN